MTTIDIQVLASAFSKHVANCPSSRILCSFHVASEGWFRAELAYVLTNLGAVSFEYCYEGSPFKADLCLGLNGRKVALELKCFVKGADANKLDKFPRQLQLLRNEALAGKTSQAVAFCTFIGYTDDKMKSLCSKFFPQPWETTSLLAIHTDMALRFAFASTSV